MACQSSIVIEAGNCERVAKEFGAIKCVFVPSGVGGSNHRGGGLNIAVGLNIAAVAEVVKTSRLKKGPRITVMQMRSHQVN